MRRSVAFALVWIFVAWAPDVIALSDTPSNRNVFLYQGCEWMDEWNDTGASYRTALASYGYLVNEARERIHDGEHAPTHATLAAYNMNLPVGYGCWFQAGHGTDVGFAVEAYKYSEGGLNARDAQFEIYKEAGWNEPEEIFKAFQANVGYYIMVKDGYLLFRYHGSQSIVYNASCKGGSYAFAWLGSRVQLGYANDEFVTTVEAEASTFWLRMYGEGGVDKRSCGAAIDGLSVIVNGNGETVIAPAVKSKSLEDHQNVPPSAATLKLMFDCKVQGIPDPNGLFSILDGTSIHIRPNSAEWIIDSGVMSGVSVVVEGVASTFGESTVAVESDGIWAASSPWAHLDGDGRYGPDDVWLPLEHQPDPAADVDGIQWEDGALRWRPVTEYCTVGYRIQGRTSSDETWNSIGEVQPPGVGERSVYVGNTYREYRLIELEEGGHEILHETVQAGMQPQVVPQPRPTLVEVLAALRSKLESGPTERVAAVQAFYGEKLGILTSQQFVEELADLTSYLQGYFGMTVQTVTVEQFGAPENRYTGIKGRIASLYGQGYRYFLLVGDASDWEYFDGPYTAEYWPPVWEGIRQEYFTSGFPHGGDPQNNVIPAVMVKDPLPRRQNMAFYQPYYMLSDMVAYGDVDNDGLPDAVVTRWPFTAEVDVAAMALKLLFYLDHGGWGYESPYSVSTFLGDVNGHTEDGDGDRAVQTAEAIEAQFRTGTIFRELRESQYDWWDRIVAAVDLWHTGSEFALFVASGSDRYRPGHFFQLADGFSMDLIVLGSFTPFVLGASCGTGDLYRTQSPYNDGLGTRSSDDGLPISHRFLAAYDKGAIAWVGPSAGTYQSGNQVVGERIVEYIEADPGRPTGESVRLAIRDILQETPPTDLDVLSTCKSYNYFGFGLAPLNHKPQVVGVHDGEKNPPVPALSLRVPSPINGKARVDFSLPRRVEMSLRAYDVTGRLVATLARGLQEGGWHTAEWEPDRKVPSGQYYLKLQADGESVTRTVSVIR